MTSDNFVYWLQGFMEISNTEELTLSKEQVQVIKDHIKLVLSKSTPERTISQPNPSAIGQRLLPLSPEEIAEELKRRSSLSRPHYEVTCSASPIRGKDGISDIKVC